MIPLTEQKDKELTLLVRTDKSVRAIAVITGVSQGAVASFRRATEVVDAMPESMKENIRRLLWGGTSLPQTARMLGIPSESVYSLRRIDRFLGPPDGASECSKCGTKLFAPATERKREKMRGHISQDNVRLIGDIVTDLIELGDLRLIPHPLFYLLVQRAEKVYRKIHDKEANKEE